MYGLIHRAIRDCITESYGEESSAKIVAATGLDESHFVSMEGYSDDVAFSLIGTACETLDVEPADLMMAFGRYWVLNTARVHYGPLLAFGGRDLNSFLKNLDAMHEQVAITFANLKQPSFEREIVSDDAILLHYRSVREGLSAFVLGLLDGLAQHFEETIQVEQVAFKAEGADHDVFRIELRS